MSQHSLSSALKNLPVLEPGWIWLTGAGPGDPGLLTLHALNGLAQADVIVYDALVDPRILDLAGNQTERIHAGKRGGKPSPKQRDISLKLVDLARQGARVCRLKGGDPLVFGRGGEEALALVEAGVPFRIIPGISAGIGALAYAGIPLTHRDFNHAVTFLTGHDQNGLTPSTIDWPALAAGSPVIVMYMAMKHLGLITERLMAAGRDPGEPVAIICNGTTPRQQILETTLATAEQDLRAATMSPPGIVVLGRNVQLRKALDWLGAMEGRILERDPVGRRPTGDRSTGS